MPTYNYSCQNSSCPSGGMVQEATHRMTESKPHCEVCGGELQIVHSVPVVKYKGNWFSTTKGY